MTNRDTLFSATSASLPGSTSLGEFQTGVYARLVGLFSVIGSITVRYQMNFGTGLTGVASSFVVNSGPNTFDVLSYGRTTQFTITAANSQVYNAWIAGQIAR